MDYKRTVAALLFAMVVFTSNAQHSLYPPNTKWYQDPLGFRPVQLSSTVGFIWGALTTSACLLFTNKDQSFQEKIFLYEEAGTTFGYNDPYTTVFQNSTGFMYKLRPWMAIGAAINIQTYKDIINNTPGFGLSPFARWYITIGKRISPFFEYGAGASYTLEQFPLKSSGTVKEFSGTRFNFNTRYAVGSEVRLTELFILQAGVRHFHLSNGNIKGAKKNPWHDSNGVFVGLLYKLFQSPKFK